VCRSVDPISRAQTLRMKLISSSSRQSMRAMKRLATRCSTGKASNNVSSWTPGNSTSMPAFSSQPAKFNGALWPFPFHTTPKRLPASFRTFNSGSGGGGGASGGSSGGGGGGGGFGSLWISYLALLDRKPVATKAITAAVLNGVGDVIAQLWLGEGSFDWKRLSIFSFLGLVLIGPALHIWYGSLSRLVSATGTPGALGRMALDQLAFAPIFIGSIVAAIMTMEGHAKDVPAKLKADLPTIVRSNWVLWVPFQFLNFRFVPVRLQVLASNCVALAWNTYMSWAAHRSVA
jgi:hypothetical protein